MSVNLPKKFIENIKNIDINWLNNLKKLIRYFQSKWSLTGIKNFDNLSYNYVAVAYSSIYKREVVLKICLPSKEFQYEYRALLFYEGKACVKLLDYDLKNYGLLLEYLVPGTTLKYLFPENDNKSIEIVSKLIKELHTKKLEYFNMFPKLYDWLKIFDLEISSIVSSIFLDKAKKLRDQLLNTQCDLFILHGDLHQENILKHQSSWKAIDPKGIIGELAYEAGAFIRNPIKELLEQENSKQIIINRVSKFSEILNIDKRRILQWVYVQTVLALCWSIQDNSNNYVQWLKLVELLDPII